MTYSSRTLLNPYGKVRAFMSAGHTTLRNLLILRLSSFGDVVLAEPVVRAVKESHPECRVWFLTSEQYAGIPPLFASLDSVVAYSRQGKNRELQRIGASIEFDVIVDLQNNLRSFGIVRSLKAKTVLRYHKQRFRRFLSVRLPWIWKNGLKHTVDAYCDTIRPLALVPGHAFPVIIPPDGRVEDVRREFGVGPFIGICPGGSSQHKMWRGSQFASLVRNLSDYGHRILVIGSDSDRRVIQSIIDKVDADNVAAYVGNDVHIIATLLSMCEVTVANDSGLMHLAAAVGSRVVSIFGPTSPLLGFAPTARGGVIITLGFACSPCSYHGDSPCRYEQSYCLEAIDPIDVTWLVNDMVLERARRESQERG